MTIIDDLKKASCDYEDHCERPKYGQWFRPSCIGKADVFLEAIAEIERLRIALDVHKRYINRDIQTQIDAAFETKARTGKFPFED